MAESGLKERLQPDLLERLQDEARQVTIYTLTTLKSDLIKLQINERDLVSILQAQGLRIDESRAALTDNEKLNLNFMAGSLAASLGQIKQLVLKPPGAEAGIALHQFCTIESQTRLNDQLESAARQLISTRKLRECVLSNLSSLLNTVSLDVIQNLEHYPHVARSVLNYGMPSFAGRSVHSVDPAETARRMREAIEVFEPRLTRVQVIPETEDNSVGGVMLNFRIEADLWGFPVSQQLLINTSIDMESGDVVLGDLSGG